MNNKVLQSEWFEQQKLIFSQFYSLETRLLLKEYEFVRLIFIQLFFQSLYQCTFSSASSKDLNNEGKLLYWAMFYFIDVVMAAYGLRSWQELRQTHLPWIRNMTRMFDLAVSIQSVLQGQ